MTLMATIFALLLSLFLIPRNAFAGDDACRHQLPKELVSAIAEPKRGSKTGGRVDFPRRLSQRKCNLTPVLDPCFGVVAGAMCPKPRLIRRIDTHQRQQRPGKP